jgi:hypothetical protein
VRRFRVSAPIYGRMDERGVFVRTRPRWMRLRAVLGALVPRSGPVVIAVDRDAGVITVGQPGQEGSR